MIDINSEKKSQYQNILTDEAISFLEKVCSTFENTRQEILKNRVKMQNDISSGKRLSFPKDKKIREDNLRQKDFNLYRQKLNFRRHKIN